MGSTTPPRPRARAIADDLRRRIVRGAWRPGRRLPSRLDLERRFVAAPGTVQQALDLLAREGFVHARRGLGTFVVPRPPHLFRYALVLPDRPTPAHPWSRYLQTLHALAESGCFEPRDLRVYYAAGGNADSEDYQHLARDVHIGRLAGLVFAHEMECLAGTGVLEHAGIPRIALGGGFLDVPAVHLDFWALLERALDHLARRQRQRVAILHSSEFTGGDGDMERLAAAAHAHRVRLERRWVHGIDKSHPQWTRPVVELMLAAETLDRPDSLIVVDDNLLPDACAGLLAAGVRARDDVEIIAACNFPWPPPSPLPVVHLGFDLQRGLATCLDALDAIRAGSALPHLDLLPVFAHEAAGSLAAGSALSAPA